MRKNVSANVPAALIIVGAVTGGLVASMTWADPTEAPAPRFVWKDGAEVYAKVCALCHDTSVAPVLLGRGHDPLYIRLIVRNGMRAMPAFRASEIDDASLEKLAEYVSNTAGDK